MSIKLKALGLALFAALAVGAVSVVSATGATGGHFTSGSSWTVLSGSQVGGNAANYIENTNEGARVICPEQETISAASVSGTTVTQITATPTFPDGCELQAAFSGPATIDTNGCDFLFTIESAEPEHTAVHLVCPEGKEVAATVDPVVVGSCVIDYPPQTPTSGGVVYAATEHSGKASLHLDITAEGITSNETPMGFLGCGTQAGESNNSDFFGTATVVGKDTTGTPVDIKATGP
jgi:hypothetical protein